MSGGAKIRAVGESKMTPRHPIRKACPSCGKPMKLVDSEGETVRERYVCTNCEVDPLRDTAARRWAESPLKPPVDVVGQIGQRDAGATIRRRGKDARPRLRENARCNQRIRSCSVAIKVADERGHQAEYDRPTVRTTPVPDLVAISDHVILDPQGPPQQKPAVNIDACAKG
jgi:hypothetical protein